MSFRSSVLAARRRAGLFKNAAAILTPEAEQAAVQGMPMDPSMQGGMPPQGMPMDPSMQGGIPPQGMPPQGGMGGQLPPEIMQDQQFMAFMQEAMGCAFDPNYGQFIEMRSGQPVPPEMIMQAYQAFQQQAANMSAQGGMPQDPYQTPQEPNDPMQGYPYPAMQGGAQMSSDMMSQVQTAIDSAIQSFTASLDKKLETLMDKLDTVKMAIEAVRDTDDQRSEAFRQDKQDIRDALAAELAPTVKQASAAPIVQPVNKKYQSKPQPIPLFNVLCSGLK